jgi:predicted esterase
MTKHRPRARYKRLLAAAAGVVLTLVAIYAAGHWYRGMDYRERFLILHGSPAVSEVSHVEDINGHRLFSVRLENDLGVGVDGFLKVPAQGDGPYPALLLLGGVRTGRKTIDYIRNTSGVVLFALDYPYDGKNSRMSALEFVGAIPNIRRAVVRTVPAVMLAVDYLLERSDVDPDRIVLVGGSVGALFAPAAAATDERIAAAAMLFGAGDLQSLMRTNIKIPGIAAGPVCWLGAVLVSPVEPGKYVGRIAPRPVFMLNGTGDPRMPERNSRLLHEAAGAPKTIRWIDAGHVNIRDEKFHGLVARELADWLVGCGLISRENFVHTGSE